MSAYSEHTFSFPKLNNENYKEWKYSIDLYLISQDLQNYTSDKIIDEEKSPSKTPDAEKEKLKEGKALAVICLSIREDLKNIVYEAHTPSEAWKLLKTVFEPVSRARVARLRRNFMNTRYTPDEPEVHCVEVKIPCTFRESQELPEKREWNRAMKNELETLKDRKVYELVPRPEGTKVLGTRWIFTLKRDMSGSVKRFRARLVAKGFRQIEGVNYFDTFSPVISFSLVRLFYTILVVLKGWVSQHLDIKCAYLYAKLSELIFVEQPEGFVENTKEGFVWKLDLFHSSPQCLN